MRKRLLCHPARKWIRPILWLLGPARGLTAQNNLKPLKYLIGVAYDTDRERWPRNGKQAVLVSRGWVVQCHDRAYDS